jgi:hypothetical protein
MKVNVLYDKYNTKIDKATVLFGDIPEEEKSIDLEIIETNTGTEELPVLVETIKLTTIDSNSVEISNEMDKEELRTFFNIIKNLLSQMK